MGWFSGNSEQAQFSEQFSNFDGSEQHKAKLSHEVIGGAAAYEAMKAYEEHQAKNGKPASHAEAKEILAGLAGAFIDREFETKGLDFIDKERAKHHAKQQLEEASAADF
ncbi:putative phosphoglycerate mutase family protein [Aspergillus heteromorphus CBS 117.55]|uniref:Putative phosphoglycerate mutase family protein n=1 Tax=Aspergillus heteromorphus CBS 117.55 TaxID=1448321 RepID=A0A317WM07_9EURO|nr:putative phosphoglycerate mutase family protein [Aspergillus heteromorphus CBS 117.55]PWY87379.1 putative phosphoglycerate mutase family protein [Aspergillus heteromorphus CBS 117.55]